MQKLLARIERRDSLTAQQDCPVLCYYKNTTDKMQIARISNIPNWQFERLVFPEEQLLFEALPGAELEIHTTTRVGSSLFDKIPCTHLQVHS